MAWRRPLLLRMLKLFKDQPRSRSHPGRVANKGDKRRATDATDMDLGISLTAHTLGNSTMCRS
jgi:hypothetical protein